jgi:26S proteasome non-ATPase regulatory subunit 9
MLAILSLPSGFSAHSRVIELRNDIKDLSERIRALLEVALARPTVPVKVAAVAETTNLETTAFALVNGVAPGSPAASAVSHLLLLYVDHKIVH